MSKTGIVVYLNNLWRQSRTVLFYIYSLEKGEEGEEEGCPRLELQHIHINTEIPESNHTLFYEIFIPWKGDWREGGSVSKAGILPYLNN
jgi:hypothetical protein